MAHEPANANTNVRHQLSESESPIQVLRPPALCQTVPVNPGGPPHGSWSGTDGLSGAVALWPCLEY